MNSNTARGGQGFWFWIFLESNKKKIVLISFLLPFILGASVDSNTNTRCKNDVKIY